MAKPQVQEIKLDSEIIPNKGIGDIHLGMNCFYLRKLFSENYYADGGYSDEANKGDWSSKLWDIFLQNLDLNYNDFISITVNLFTGQVSHIRVKNTFSGKILNTVGIGDTVKIFYQKAPSLNCKYTEFSEGEFFSGFKTDMD